MELPASCWVGNCIINWKLKVVLNRGYTCYCMKPRRGKKLCAILSLNVPTEAKPAPCLKAVSSGFLVRDQDHTPLQSFSMAWFISQTQAVPGCGPSSQTEVLVVKCDQYAPGPKFLYSKVYSWHRLSLHFNKVKPIFIPCLFSSMLAWWPLQSRLVGLAFIFCVHSNTMPTQDHKASSGTAFNHLS